MRVFPRLTSYTPRDELAFHGYPPLLRPDPDEVGEVHVSVSFTWDLKTATRLRDAWADHYPVVKMGGPALGQMTAASFVPGRYVKQGVTFTTRGCNRRCPWCFVPEREGRIVEIPDFAPGWIVQDNNFLQATQEHQDRVFAMLAEQPKAARFAGGIDPRLVDQRFADRVRDARVESVYLAADTSGMLRPLRKALGFLTPHLRRQALRVYTLIGYGDDTIDKALVRLEAVWDAGGMPFAQLYQPRDRYIDYTKDWRRLSRTWTRPAAMMALHKAASEGALPLLDGWGHERRESAS
jgi:hypothetical protein